MFIIQDDYLLDHLHYAFQQVFIDFGVYFEVRLWCKNSAYFDTSFALVPSILCSLWSRWEGRLHVEQPVLGWPDCSRENPLLKHKKDKLHEMIRVYNALTLISQNSHVSNRCYFIANICILSWTLQWNTSYTYGFLKHNIIFTVDIARETVFIRPFEKRTYYAVAMSVRPSVRLSVRPPVRPGFPDFSSTFFEISIWNLVYTFSRWHDMSSLSCITIGSLWPSLQPKVGQNHFLQSWPHKSR